MKRNQTFHETLIPMLVEGIGAKSYLEFGTHQNQTIGKVRCEKRYGVDRQVISLSGAEMFHMTTEEFIKGHARECGPFDFVFIDADHRREAVEADFYGIIDHVTPEGLVCLHDTNPETEADTKDGLCSDAWTFPRTLSTYRHEAVTLPYHPGLTIVRNRKTWGPA